MNEFPDNNKDSYIWRIQREDTYTIYTRDGRKHSILGPAVTIGTDKYYYINGELLTYTQWHHYTTGVHAYEPDYYTREMNAWYEAEVASNMVYVDGDSPAEHL